MGSGWYGLSASRPGPAAGVGVFWAFPNVQQVVLEVPGRSQAKHRAPPRPTSHSRSSEPIEFEDNHIILMTVGSGYDRMWDELDSAEQLTG